MRSLTYLLEIPQRPERLHFFTDWYYAYSIGLFTASWIDAVSTRDLSHGVRYSPDAGMARGSAMLRIDDRSRGVTNHGQT